MKTPSRWNRNSECSRNEANSKRPQDKGLEADFRLSKFLLLAHCVHKLKGDMLIQQGSDV